MSRKAKVPVTLPTGVEAKVNGKVISIKGPKGELTQEFRSEVNVVVKDDGVHVTLNEKFPQANNFTGLYWSLITNMVKGVSEGYKKSLEMIGVGFRAAVKGKNLDLQVGYSHPVELPIPEGIAVKVEKNTIIELQGSNKQQLGQFAADIRAKRPPEPYKGKGIRYTDEYVRRKAGKAGKK